MTYKVHKFPIEKDINEELLAIFLNDLQGQVVSIIPNIKPKMHMMGATAGYDFLLIIEMIN